MKAGFHAASKESFKYGDASIFKRKELSTVATTDPIVGFLLAVALTAIVGLTKVVWDIGKDLSAMKQQIKQTEETLKSHALQIQQHDNQFALVMPTLARLESGISDVRTGMSEMKESLREIARGRDR